MYRRVKNERETEYGLREYIRKHNSKQILTELRDKNKF